MTEEELKFAHELVEAWLSGNVPSINNGGSTNLSEKICEQLKKSTAK